MINTIFLDLDDVLAEFTMAALQCIGCPVGIREHHRYDPKWGFDIIKAANWLHLTHTFTPERFWAALPREFWECLPKTKECDWLVEACAALVGKENVCILTAPTYQPYVAAAKIAWIHKVLPEWLHGQFLIGKPKYFCARQDALLIDDSRDNVDYFRAFGGQAILMPRPWNPLFYLKDAQRYVHDQLVLRSSASPWRGQVA